VQTSISVEDPDYPVHPDVARVEVSVYVTVLHSIAAWSAQLKMFWLRF